MPNGAWMRAMCDLHWISTYRVESPSVWHQSLQKVDLLLDKTSHHNRHALPASAIPQTPWLSKCKKGIIRKPRIFEIPLSVILQAALIMGPM